MLTALDKLACSMQRGSETPPDWLMELIEDVNRRRHDQTEVAASQKAHIERLEAKTWCY